MSAENPSENVDEANIIIEFSPKDPESARALKEVFAQNEILEANSFTGVKTIAIVTVATRTAISVLLAFFNLHRNGFHNAVVKIGKNEVSLKGYSSDQVRELLDSPQLQKLLRELKKK